MNLSEAPGAGQAWDRPSYIVFAWGIVELLLVTNAWQISSALRIWALRLFGAQIGADVIIRPRTRVKFPWKLSIGDRSWIGEGVWIHNQGHVSIGSDCVISQETFVTTGSHAYKTNMALLTKPVKIESGAWVTSRCVLTGGITIGRSALVQPMTLVTKDVPSNSIFGSERSKVVGQRFAAGHAPWQGT